MNDQELRKWCVEQALRLDLPFAILNVLHGL